MNIFFYAGAASRAAEKFIEQLRTSDTLSAITVLPGGSRLNSYDSLMLRNGDVVVLFASTDKEFEALLTLYDRFEDFRVILVIHEQNDLTDKWCYRFKPRFTTFVDSDMANMEKVVAKMQKQVRIWT